MSQLASTKPAVRQQAPRESTSTQKTRTLRWWVLTIKPTHKDYCDAVVGHIVTPLVAQARLWGAERGTFARNLDPKRPQVEVHVLASDDIVNRLRTFALALTRQSADLLGDLETSEVQPGCYPPRHDEQPLPRIEAALAKYGGIQGIALTLEVSEVSCDLAAWAIGRFPNTNTRSALAALLLFDACHSMMYGPRSALWPDRKALSWDYYWDSHLRSSTAAFGDRAAHARTSLTRALAPRIVPAHRSMIAVASEPSVENWRKRWVRAIDSYLYRADKSRISRSAQHLAMIQSRHLLNRLGIPLRDEAALGLYARAWSKEREEELVRMHS